MIKKTIQNFYLLLPLVLFGIGVSSCSSEDVAQKANGDPLADFTTEPAVDHPQLISFINNSQNAEEFVWDFGDGTELSTQKHPIHRYETAGIYTVVLTAVNGELSDVFSQDLKVTGIPTAGFIYSFDADNPYTVHFENQSENVDTFTWYFGDSVGSSIEENPVYTYSEPGEYLVSLTAIGEGGTVEMSMLIEVSDAQPAFSDVFIVGDATTRGWNLDTPEALTRGESNPYIFTYEGIFTPGKLKFSTFTGDFCEGEWLNAIEPAMEVPGVSTYVVTQGCEGPDHQWVVTEVSQGRYSVRIDLEKATVEFTKRTPEFSELYAIGEASPNGWLPQSPKESFIQDPVDPFVFTYEAYLTTGELKISTFVGEWCEGSWLQAPEPNQPISEAEYVIKTGCVDDDYKWWVSEEGDYLITVNLYEETIIFEKL